MLQGSDWLFVGLVCGTGTENISVITNDGRNIVVGLGFLSSVSLL